MIKIQNVIINDDILPGNRNMFYTLDKRLHCSVLGFGTYFNCLWPQAWKEYTSLNRFCLNIKFKGECTISLIRSHFVEIKTNSSDFGYSVSEEVSRHTFYRQQHASTGADYIQIEFADIDPAFRMIHFEIEYANNKTFEYIEAFYSAESANSPARVKTAIVICTFKREQFVYRNIDILKKFFRENPDLREIYDVFVVDNGRTVSFEIAAENIYLYPNKNTGGGSGGFTRGMIEAIQSDRNYTHVLLMDDDIEINTEALQRTWALAALINRQYRRAFISGSMFRRDIRDFQWEARAKIRGLLLDIYGQFSLQKFTSLLKNELIASKHTSYDYAAWWYCCIPLEAIGPDKLPFPFFIRGDDIDYALKFADKIIHLNGICIWHEPFGGRRSNTMDIYITVRNFTTFNILHKIPILLTVRDLMNLFAGNIFTYNYKGAYLVCRGLQDAVGKINIYEKDQIGLLNHYKAYDEIENDYDIDLPVVFNPKKLGLFMKTLILLTYGSHLLPGLFFRKKTATLAGYRITVIRCFASKKVYVYNPQSGKCTVREINRISAFGLGFQFFFLLLKFILFFPSIRKNLQKKEKEYRTIEFWKKHLELDG